MYILNIIFMFFLASFFGELSCEIDKELPCTLLWKEYSRGDVIDLHSVYSHEGISIVARVDIEGQYVIGNMDKNRDKSALFPILIQTENDTQIEIVEFFNFDLLTNPEKCDLKWVALSNGEKPSRFEVSAGNESTIYVGRGSTSLDGNFVWTSGGISSELEGILVPDENFDDNLPILTEYQGLMSYTPGLVLTVTDAKYDDSEQEGTALSFLGLDEIRNGASSTVRQSITHTNSFIESKSLTLFQSATTSKKITLASFNIIVYKTEVTMENRITESKEETWETITEVTITSTREVSVPEFSSVQACTTVELKEGVDLEYTARGVYSAPGHTPQQILKLLEEEGIQAQLDDDQVFVTIQGKIKGAFMMNTQFVVVPLGPNSDCLEKQQISFRNRLSTKGKNATNFYGF